MRTALCLLLSLALLSGTGPALAQDSPTPTPTASAPNMPSVSAMMSDVESTLQLLSRVNDRWRGDRVLLEVDTTELGLLLNQESDTLRATLAAAPSMEQLSLAEVRWRNLAASVVERRNQLNLQAAELDEDIRQLGAQIDSWKRNLETKGAVPLAGDLQANIDRALHQLRESLQAAENRRAEFLALLVRIGNEDARIQSALESIRTARATLLNESFVNESPPIWAVDLGQLGPELLGPQLSACFRQHQQELRGYSRQHRNLLLLQALSFSLVYLALRWARSRVRRWRQRDAGLAETAAIFDYPGSLAVLLTVLLGFLLQNDPPLSVKACEALVSMIPGLILLKRMSPAGIRPALFWLALLFLVDVLRLLVVPCVVLHRMIFTLDVTIAALCLGTGLYYRSAQAEIPLWHQLLRGLGVVLFSLAWLAVNLGFVRLAYLLGDSMLRSLYLAALLVCLVHIADGLLFFAIRSRLLAGRPSVRNFGTLYLQRAGLAVRVLAACFWLYSLAKMVGVIPWILDGLEKISRFGVHFHSLHITLGGLLIMGLALWLPYQLSRFVRFLIQEDFSTHLQFSRGEFYTVSTLIHYALLSAGFLAGVLAVGVDIAQFTVVAGALSVGIGFGLRDLVSNLVSGLILLIERPIQVGDFVELASCKGTLEKVGIRASVLRTTEGSEVIVPNGDLLSKQITNWTFSDQRRCLFIEGTVKGSVDADLVQAKLLELAQNHPAVLPEPPAAVVFHELGDNQLKFQLRAWTDHFATWTDTRSQLVRGVHRILGEASEPPLPPDPADHSPEPEPGPLHQETSVPPND